MHLQLNFTIYFVASKHLSKLSTSERSLFTKLHPSKKKKKIKNKKRKKKKKKILKKQEKENETKKTKNKIKKFFRFAKNI